MLLGSVHLGRRIPPMWLILRCLIFPILEVFPHTFFYGVSADDVTYVQFVKAQ